jgi:UDP-galactopyranose mutase
MDKMYARKAFKCSICGKEYENAMDRAHCELACGKKQEEDARKLAEAKKKEQQEARWAEVEAVRKHYEELYEAYMKDYEAEAYNNAIGYYNWVDKILKMFED